MAGNSKLLHSTVVALQVCLERLAPLVGDDDGGVDVLLALVVAQVRDPPLSQLALHGEFELRSGWKEQRAPRKSVFGFHKHPWNSISCNILQLNTLK